MFICLQQQHLHHKPQPHKQSFFQVAMARTKRAARAKNALKKKQSNISVPQVRKLYYYQDGVLQEQVLQEEQVPLYTLLAQEPLQDLD